MTTKEMDETRRAVLALRGDICDFLMKRGVSPAEGATAMIDLVALMTASTDPDEAAQALESAVAYLRSFHAFYCRTSLTTTPSDTEPEGG